MTPWGIARTREIVAMMFKTYTRALSSLSSISKGRVLRAGLTLRHSPSGAYFPLL